MIVKQAKSTLFPYTTLFRSSGSNASATTVMSSETMNDAPFVGLAILTTGGALMVMRSEEHTSELQSHVKLVCRLLLEKKKRDGSQFEGPLPQLRLVKRRLPM